MFLLKLLVEILVSSMQGNEYLQRKVRCVALLPEWTKADNYKWYFYLPSNYFTLYIKDIPFLPLNDNIVLLL